MATSGDEGGDYVRRAWEARGWWWCHVWMGPGFQKCGHLSQPTWTLKIYARHWIYILHRKWKTKPVDISSMVHMIKCLWGRVKGWNFYVWMEINCYQRNKGCCIYEVFSVYLLVTISKTLDQRHEIYLKKKRRDWTDYLENHQLTNVDKQKEKETIDRQNSQNEKIK